MAKMAFWVPQVRQCLLRHGRVLTVRSYLVEGRFGRLVQADGVGLCWRELVGQVKAKQDLLPFVQFSGFDNVDQWWDQVMRFCAGKDKWLYKVTKYKNGA
jgi:hypothetical protein